MMSLPRCWLPVFFMALWCIPMYGGTNSMAHLYQGNIAVTSESAKERKKAITEAFEQVLMKVSGNREITHLEGVKEKLTAADAYVQQYRYIHVSPFAGEQEHMLLQVKFDAQGVDKLMASVGQGVWNSERPLSLLWIATSTPAGRKLVTSDSFSFIPQLIQEAAEQQGLPIVLPTLDLHDVQTVTFNDVWLPFTTVLEQHSRRYHKDAMVIVRMTQDEEETWQTRWILQYKDQWVHWKIEGPSLPVVIKEALGEINDYFVAHGEIKRTVGTPQQVAIGIGNVKTAAHYAKVMDYLQHLSGVSDVEVKSVAGDHLLVWLNVLDYKTTLQEALAESDILQSVEEAPGQLVDGVSGGEKFLLPELEYRLLS